eukprot:scaffold19531_cov162-Skeletonema_marinoi.AAC.1
MVIFNGSPKAVDCRIHTVRYDMVLESRAGGRLRCLIRSPVVATPIRPKNASAVKKMLPYYHG